MMMACRAEISAMCHCNDATAPDVCAVDRGGGWSIGPALVHSHLTREEECLRASVHMAPER